MATAGAAVDDEDAVARDATRGATREGDEGDGAAAEAAAAAREATAPSEVEGQTLPMRVLDEYEFRDKFAEGKAVSVHGSRPNRVLVLGRARKLEGGEHGLPSEVLAAPLTPQDKPPHALKLMEVHDWTIKYGGDEPELWLVTPRAWYKLLNPAPRFEKYVTVTTRRANFTNAIVRALVKNWELSLEEGLDIILGVPVVAHDVPVAVKTPTKAAKMLGDTTAEAQKEAALNGCTEEEIRESKDTSAYKYTHADIVGDGFFIVSQIETLVRCKALRPPTASEEADVPAPQFLTALQTWTTEKHQLGSATKASRLERDRARREKLRAEKKAEKESESKPRVPRLEPPPPASPILPEYSHIGPHLQAELLTLWDFAQVFASVMYCPRSTLERFAKAFFGSDLGAAEATLLRDFMVSCLRVTEGRIDSIDQETIRSAPTRARWWDAPVLGLNDIGELDWQDRANNLIVEFQMGVNARMRKPALEAVAKLDKGEVLESFSPVHRIALAVALSSIALESETIREYFTEIYDDVRARRRTGDFHSNPPTLATEVPKPTEEKKKETSKEINVKDENPEVVDDADESVSMEVDETDASEELVKPPTLADYRREQLMKWKSEAVERAVISRGKPVAVDEQGRRYFALGGTNNAGRLFVETAPPGWYDGDEDAASSQVIDGVEYPKQPMAGPPVEDAPFSEDAANTPDCRRNVSGLVECASRWGVYTPGTVEYDALSYWCNPKYDNERYITKLHRLMSHAVDGDADAPELSDDDRRKKVEILSETLAMDGYANLDDVALGSVDDAKLTSRLFNAVKFILHSAPFWRTGDMRWIDRFIRTCTHFESALNASEQSLVRLLKVLPGIEIVCAQAGLMDDVAWPDAKPTWLAQLRYYVFGPRTEAELEGTTAAPEVSEPIPGINDILAAPELLDPLPPLTVRRAANLVNQFLRFLVQDPQRMSQGAFQMCTGVSHGVGAINTGEVVAVIKRGLVKTYNRYVDKKSRPRNWIDVNTLRPVERCVVLGTAYRGSEAPRRNAASDGDTPPCAWLMCLLLDDPELSQFPSTRRQSADAEQADAKEAKDERRLIIAPLYAGGDIAEYVLPWSKYQEVDEKPWDGGSRIIMHFEGVDAENEARGIVSVDGCVYYLGRVRKVRSSPDRWETVMVVFDSDPEDYMWVSPWEIIAAPEKYHDPVHEGPAPVDHERELSPEDMTLIAQCKAIARRLGWPSGDHRRDFDKFRAEAFAGGVIPQAPIFCGAQMNLHRVFIEAMHLGGYEQVTRCKFWKVVARTLGRDLSTQTSASFAMRKYYEKCLFPLEKYLTSAEMIENLGIVIEASTDPMDRFPASRPATDFDDDDDRVDDGDDDDDMDDEDDADGMDVVDKKKKEEDADDYKISDDDFDEDDPSDSGESDSDFKGR